MARDEAVLLDIAHAARLIVEFRQGMDKATFLKISKSVRCFASIDGYGRGHQTALVRFPRSSL